MGVKRMSLFIEVQDKVRNLIQKEAYNDVITVCKEKLQYLEKNSIESDNDYWFLNLRLAIGYRRLGQCKKAIFYVNKGSLYSRTQKETMECWWTLASCYYSLGNKQRAIKFYKKCQDYYISINDENGYLSMKYNIAKINEDINTVLEIVSRLNKIEEKIYTIDNAYAFICEQYAKNNQFDMIDKYLHNIHSESVLRDLENTIAKYTNNYVCYNAN
jgi:tetratricopeptide (TPR) repeat protein